MPKYKKKEPHNEMNIHQVLLELIVGRLVLQLPIEELREINRMIVRNLENAQVQDNLYR